MPKPISRKELIRRPRSVGLIGPKGGGSHMAMYRGKERVTAPNPHGGDFDWTLTKRILKKTGIDPKDWDAPG